jgi:GNAT superfamily N-acetyltransferase
MYHCVLENGLTVKNPTLDDVEMLAEVQRLCYPTLAEAEIILAEHYASHINIFQAGQVGVYDGERLIASATALRYSDVTGDHDFLDVSGNLWLTTHEPDGEWLYGIDMGVHPDYRGLGLARQMYRARHAYVQQNGLKGQAIAGMLPGFGQYADDMSIQTYYEKVKNHEIFDPTTSVQERMGFEIVRLFENYLTDPSSGNASVLMLLSADKNV